MSPEWQKPYEIPLGQKAMRKDHKETYVLNALYSVRKI